MLSGTGDLIAQSIEAAVPAISMRRLLALIVVNVLYVVPIITMLYALNERLVGVLGLRAGWKRVGLQVVIDQAVGAPIAIAGFFYAF